jgi:hypothetical protein
MSICFGSSPCTAEAGNAWWPLCHDSPNDGSASSQTFRLSSRVLNGRLPYTWQIELIEKVTCWKRKIRISPPQTIASRPACHVP